MPDRMSDAEFLRSIAHSGEIGDPIQRHEIERLREIADRLSDGATTHAGDES